MNVGDEVTTPSGKTGTVLELFRRRETLEGTVSYTPRVLVLITCAITPTDFLTIRDAYAPEDLEDRHATQSHA